jgi:pectate lyase
MRSKGSHLISMVACFGMRSLVAMLVLSGCQSSNTRNIKDIPKTPKTGEVSATPERPTSAVMPTMVVWETIPVPAFPGAEGFGANTPGGRGGKTILVSNLNDSGPGSLRAAIEAKEPRIVVFRVAGTIKLESSLDITSPYITIAGQTAPGGGITLRNIHARADPLIAINTHDVIVRYLTLRTGPPAAGDAMGIISRSHDAYNIIIDHNSMSWGVDQVFATWYDVHNISIQWNIFSEALDCSIHPKGCHSKGSLLGSYASDENKNQPGAKNISFHHNLMAHNGERNPLIKTSGVCDVVNNVVYNPFGTFSHVDMDRQLALIPVNYIGNYFKVGPDTTLGKYGIRAINPGEFGAQIFVQGNIGPHREEVALPEINIVDPNSRQYVTNSRNPAPRVTTTTAVEAYIAVLENAGAKLGLNCDGSFFDRRDEIDKRIINDVVHGTGKIIDDPLEVGGWLTIPLATPCDDADLDGMPDAWEKIFGFNPNDPFDSRVDNNGNGYTNLEDYLNGASPIY